MSEEKLGQWRELSEAVLVGMQEWRVQHFKASMGEIEKELDQRLARLRARMLQDAATQSEAKDWQETEKKPVCPECREVLQMNGEHKRQLQTHGLLTRFGLWTGWTILRDCPPCPQALRRPR